VALQGQPTACKGRAARDQDQDAEPGWLEFSWTDGSTLEQSFLLPETFVLRYSNPQGFTQADAVIAGMRAYAGKRGLHIDWEHPKTENGVAHAGAARTVEYQDAAVGVNGFVRFMYDARQRLVAASLSVAL